MIVGSEKRNRQLAFELENSHVCEKRSNTSPLYIYIYIYIYIYPHRPRWHARELRYKSRVIDQRTVTLPTSLVGTFLCHVIR